MPTPTARAWRRTQETPLELTVAMVGAVIAATNLAGRTDALTFFAIVFYIALLIGGLTTTVGRLRDELAVESVGLVLMVGGFAFSTLRGLGRATTGLEVTASLLSGGMLALGLIIRLVVVRKALRARTHVGARQARSG